MNSRSAFLLLFVVLLAAALLRFWHLNARSVWFDEAFSLELATNCGFVELLDRTGRDVHPPGYYLVLKAWMSVAPRTEYGIRSLSAILGVCGVGLLYLVTRRLTLLSNLPQINRHSEWIALSAAILLATNAQHIYWSREARMYTLGVCLTLLSTWLMLRWLEERSWHGGALTAASVAALMLTHNYGLFTVSCQACCVVWYEWCFRRQSSIVGRIRNVVAALFPWIVAGWIYLPWFTVLLQQRARVQEEFWIEGFSWRTIPAAFYMHVFPLNDVGPVLDWLVLISAAGVLFAAGGVTLWFLLRAKWRRDMWAIPAMMGLGPICIAVVVSIVSVSVIETRHLSYCFPFLLMMFSSAVFWLIPREWAIYVLIFATGWSLFGEFQHRASLQTEQRGGVRAAMKALLPKISESEIVVVQHPGIYHAVCFYLPNRDRIKLYLPAGLPRHFFGRPLIRKAELISGMELDELQQPRLVAIDTGGFGGDQGFPLPERWRRKNEQVEWFQDVAWFQGSIAAAEYLPAASSSAASSSVMAETEAVPVNHRNAIRTSEEFAWDFTEYQFDREWFSLPAGVGESGQIRPTASGLSFRPSVALRRENQYLSVRQNLSGDFRVSTAWKAPGADSLSEAINLRLLLTQDHIMFDVEPVDIRITPHQSSIVLQCGGQSASIKMPRNALSTNCLQLLLAREGRKLSVRATVDGESCQCETRISEQPMQLHLGQVAIPLKAGSISDSAGNVRCVLKNLQASAKAIHYDGDDGVPDMTIPPSNNFWKLWGVAGALFLGTYCLWRQRPDRSVA